MPSPLSTGNTKVSVQVLLSDGKKIEGSMYLSQGNRLLDHMNDARNFLPLECQKSDELSKRKILVINKREIVHIQEV